MDIYFQQKNGLRAVFLFIFFWELFCSLRQGADALGTQCLFHRNAVFINGDTLKIRMECPVRRALGKAFGVTESSRLAAYFTFCHFVQFLSYLWSALFQLQTDFSLSFLSGLSTNKKIFYHNFLIFCEKPVIFQNIVIIIFHSPGESVSRSGRPDSIIHDFCIILNAHQRGYDYDTGLGR